MHRKIVGHHILKCKECGEVISECKCLTNEKPTYYDICDKCLKITQEKNNG